MTDIITETPDITVALLADAMTELADAATDEHSIPGDLLDTAAVDAAAVAFNTSSPIVRMAVDYVSRGRQPLEALVAAGLSERNEMLIQLGYEHMARLPADRLLAASWPTVEGGDRYIAWLDAGRGVVRVMFPGGSEMDWAVAARKRLLSIEPASTGASPTNS